MSPVEAPRIVLDRVPPFTSQGAPLFISQGAPPFTPQGAPPFTPQGAPPFTPQGAPQFTSQGAPPFTPQGAPPFTHYVLLKLHCKRTADLLNFSTLSTCTINYYQLSMLLTFIIPTCGHRHHFQPETHFS